MEINNTHNPGVLDDREEKLNTALRLYQDVYEAELSPELQSIKAEALVEIGMILYNKRKLRSLNECLPRDLLDPGVCFDKALNLYPDGVSVLETSAKYFKNIGQLEMAKQLLQKSLKINETSFAHHHLGIILKTELIKKYKSKTKFHTDKKQNDPFCFGKGKQNEPMVTKSDVSGSAQQNTKDRSESLREVVHLEPTGGHFSRKKLLQVVKNPIFPFKLPENEIKEAVEHFDKAYKLNSNNPALYDKGILLRGAGLLQQAFQAFKEVFQDKDSSLMMLANAYEQGALCNLEMVLISQNDDKRKELRYNAQIYFEKSIEYAYQLWSKYPDIRSCWVAFPTLRQMLQSQDDQRSDKAKLAGLHMKIHNYAAAIRYYEDALIEENDDNRRTKVLIPLIESCINERKFDDAILYFNMIRCLPDGLHIFDRNLYFIAHIKGGILAARNNNKRHAKNIFDNLFQSPDDHRLSTGKENHPGLKYGIAVLSSQDSEQIAREAVLLLKTFQLNAILAWDDITPGQSKLEGHARVMKESKFIMVFLAENESEDDLKFLHVVTSGLCVNVISETEKADLDLFIGGRSAICYDKKLLQSPKEQESWIEMILKRLFKTEGSAV